jgi:radical SAM protein with 4Fe4S-binding SPASM domain
MLHILDQHPQSNIAIENIGWTLGNECPYRCRHCYSMSARKKGQDLTREGIIRIVEQLALNEIKTVNLGGNEPLFTNGSNPRKTLLPFIIRSLVERNIVVGLTTAGVTLNYLAEHYPEEARLLNDVDVSLDSPFADEHNVNRGAVLFTQAIAALRLCQQWGIEHTVVLCGMNWNLSDVHIDSLVALAKNTSSNVRINFIKPTDAEHLHMMPSPSLYYRSSLRLLGLCRPVDLAESLLSTLYAGTGSGCPCGTKSFRIHSITPDGQVPVSPCVYMHDFRAGDLLTEDLHSIVRSAQFRLFRQRHGSPGQISGCGQCGYVSSCRGGCAARAYLVGNGTKSLFARDPYCLYDVAGIAEQIPAGGIDARLPVRADKVLVHQNYLCTLILEPY